MNDTQLKLEILKLPIGTVLGAHAQWGNGTFSGTPSEQKSKAADFLVSCIRANNLTLDDIKRATPIAPVSTAAPSADVSAITAVATRAEASALDAHHAINKVTDILRGINTRLDLESDARRTGVDEVKDALSKLDRKVGQVSVDDRKVAEAVAKVVADAFKPFEQAVIAAGAQAVVADLASARVVDTKTCAEAFGVDVVDAKGNPLTVDIWNDPSAPAVDPHFIWTQDILQHLILSQDTGESVWFGGPKGTGKSETARQFAAVTGRAFKRINFHKYTSAEDYIGAVGLENGQTVFKRGDFLAAFTHPSTVILLDEVTNADPGELAPLNGFLEPNSAVSFGGSVQTRAPGVLVFAADNTLGNGDDSGRYAGTRQMNSALVDRFARVIQFDYLPVASEVEALVRHTGCHPKLALHILEAVYVARKQVLTGEVIDAPSIRSVIAFIRALRVLPIDKAWATTIAARQPAESLPGLSAIYASCISETTINNYL
jgi:MoxR-like ATPase